MSIKIQDSKNIRLELWSKCANNLKYSNPSFKTVPNQKKIELTHREKIGQLIFYVVKKGGLLNSSSLFTFLQQLSSSLVYYQKRIVFPLYIKSSSGNTEQLQRWEPDILSLLLILRLSTVEKKYASSIKITNIITPVKKFLIKVSVPYKDLPMNMKDFLEVMSVEYYQNLPAYLIRYAQRKVISHAHHDSVAYRKQGDNKYYLAPIKNNNVNISIPIKNKKGNDSILENWIIVVKQCLVCDDKKMAINNIMGLKLVQGSLYFTNFKPSICHYLISWILYLLKTGSSSGNTLRLSSIQTYVSVIANKIIVAVNRIELRELTKESIEELYLGVLSKSRSITNRNNLCRMLNEFHIFMVEKYQISDINSNMLNIKKRLAPVDANIINFDEFNKFLNWLSDSNLVIRDSSLLGAARLIVILAFKCGLRRSEVLMLRLIDILNKNTETLLLIRPFQERRLKTKSSKRTIPLNCFLSANELNELKAWLVKRENAEQKHSFSPYLFSIPSQNLSYLTENIIIPIVHLGLRFVTGDSSLRFHHFRHSFCSFNIFRLYLDKLNIEIKNYITDQPLTNSWLKEAPQFREKIYLYHHIKTDDFKLISTFLGHSTADLSAEHYFHFSDNLLRLYIDHQMPRSKKSEIAHASGLSKTRAYLYQQSEEKNYKALIVKVEKNLNSQGKVFIIDYKQFYSNSLNNVKIHQKISCRGIDILSRISSMLTHYYKNIDDQNMNLEYLSNRYYFNYLDIESILDASQKYFKFMTKNRKANNNGTRSRKVKKILWQNGNRKEQYIDSLRRPRDSQNIGVFIEKLWNKFESHPDRIIWFINYFVENSWQTDNKIAFLNKNNAEDFLTLLKFLGFANKDIEITLRYGSEQQPKKLKILWKTSCSLMKNYRTKILVRKGTNKRYGKMGELRIAVLNFNGVYTSDALRYTVGLMYIYMKSTLDKEAVYKTSLI